MRDPEGKAEARLIPACFDRIHCLTRYLEPLSELSLGPLPLGTQYPTTIIHR